ncbi:hypothetical protein Tco_0654190 [Tanacetum coccineum]|uniref:Uncharacterized protein n=1 Tax=Tanacetum coccineum TaxID=301880 RepID=A0ABQ4X2L0_9ASTR
MEVFIGGLPWSIEGNVTASKPDCNLLTKSSSSMRHITKVRANVSIEHHKFVDYTPLLDLSSLSAKRYDKTHTRVIPLQLQIGHHFVVDHERRSEILSLFSVHIESLVYVKL